jgi:hypothetical protein
MNTPLARVGATVEFFVAHVGNDVGELRVLEQRLQLAPHGSVLELLFSSFGDLLAQNETGPSQVSFENLAHIHTAWHAQRVQNDFHRRSVFEVRHILFRQNARDHALVAVTAGHLVAHTQLALHGDVDLDQLDHARRQFVALGELVLLLVDDLLEHIDLARGHLLDLVDLLVDSRIFIGILDALQVAGGDALDLIAIENRCPCSAGACWCARRAGRPALLCHPGCSPGASTARRSEFGFRPRGSFPAWRSAWLRWTCALVLFLAFAREDFHIDDHALDAGGQ